MYTVDLYLESCKKRNASPNSTVKSLLADPQFTFSSVERIDVARNYLGDRGASALLDVIKECDNIRMLNLSNNGLHNRGMTEVRSALKGLKFLSELDISRNSVSENGAKEIIALLNENTSITTVNYDLTMVPEFFQLKIDDALEKNRKAAVSA